MTVLFLKTGETVEVESMEEAKMLIKLSVMINNQKNPRCRDNKRNYQIIEN